MSDVVDLDVMNIAERVYALQHDVEEQPPADDVSRNDWIATHIAVRHLLGLVSEKLPGIAVSPDQLRLEEDD